MFSYSSEVEIESFYEKVYLNTPFACLIFRVADGVIVGCNEHAETLYGYSSDILLTKTIMSINQQSSEELEIEMRRAKQNNRQFFMLNSKLSTGEIKKVHMYTLPVFYKGVDYLISFVIREDDSQSVTAYIEELKLNEVILDAVVDMIYTIHRDDKNQLVITFINEASHRLLNKLSIDILHCPIDVIVHKRDVDLYYKALNSQGIGNYSANVLHIDNNGRSIPLDVIINKIMNNNQEVLICVARDMREKTLLSNNLNYTRNLFSNLFNNSHDAMFIVNHDLYIRDFNDVAREMFDLNQSNVGNSFVETISRKDHLEIVGKLQEAIVIGYYSFRHEYEDQWGRKFYYRFIVNEIENLDHTKDYFIIVIDESDMIITQKTTQLYQQIFEHNSEGVIVTDGKGTIQWVNFAFCQLSGYKREELVGENPRILKSEKHNREFYRKMWESITTIGTFSGEIWNKSKSGNVYPTQLKIHKVNESFDKQLTYIGIVSDLTNKKSLESRVNLLYNKDRLTNLYNRYYFEEVIKNNIQHKSKFAVIVIEIDDFKKINDLKGHDYGDRILLDIASKLSFVFEKQLVARIGADEFGIIFEFTRYQIVEELLYKFFLMIQTQEHAFSRTLNYTVSSGIVIKDKEEYLSNELVKDASIAKDQARKTRGNHFSVYSEEMAKGIRHKLELEEALENAIRDNELYVMYQPIFNTHKELFCGVEALIRWEHHTYGAISPSEFIPIAENNGMINDIGYFVLEQCCKDYPIIKEYIKGEPFIAINISPLQFEQADMVAKMEYICNDYNLDPSIFEIEITESSYMTNINFFIDITEEFKSLGYSIVVDDFGTGYSSLNRLVELNIDKVKIDKSFIDHIGKTKKYEELIRVINNISNTLELDVVAEGVEKEFQYDFIKSLGIKYVQGYYKSKPIKVQTMRDVMK